MITLLSSVYLRLLLVSYQMHHARTPSPSDSILFSRHSYPVGVVKYIDNLSEDEIKRVGIPNGIPLVFKFKAEGAKLTPLPQELAEAPLSGEFLEKKGRLKRLLAAEAELAKGVPGFVSPLTPPSSSPSPSVPVSLLSLTPPRGDTAAAAAVVSVGSGTGAGAVAVDYPRLTVDSSNFRVDSTEGTSSIFTLQPIGAVLYCTLCGNKYLKQVASCGVFDLVIYVFEHVYIFLTHLPSTLPLQAAPFQCPEQLSAMAWSLTQLS
jgi:hypothetical protein